MKKDIVIYLKQTRNILAIISDVEVTGKERVISNDKIIGVDEVECNSNYIIENPENGELKYRNPKSNLYYINDYR